MGAMDVPTRCASASASGKIPWYLVYVSLSEPLVGLIERSVLFRENSVPLIADGYLHRFLGIYMVSNGLAYVWSLCNCSGESCHII